MFLMKTFLDSDEDFDWAVTLKVVESQPRLKRYISVVISNALASAFSSDVFFSWSKKFQRFLVNPNLVH